MQTYVVEYSDGLVRDAILRELARGGQVYVLYNRVQTIDVMYARLKKLVPEARIAVGHGQMREHALEDVMLDFYEGKFDVLLCTTIIEAGLDVPRANTLIVCDADRFGLAQLYQLRGRVGRSNRLAYAYLTVNPNKVLTETARPAVWPPSGSSPSSARASAWPCAIWRSAARATCWARSRAASWPRWATTSTSR